MVDHNPSAWSVTLFVATWLGHGKPFDGGCDSPSSSRGGMIAGKATDFFCMSSWCQISFGMVQQC